MHTPEQKTSGTVLLVDRAERIAQEAKELEDAGYTVISATSIAEGMKMSLEQKPSMIVAEVMLDKPDDGFVFAYRLKKNEVTANIPLMLLSSVFQKTGKVFDLNSPESRQWIKAEEYLDRPVTSERLVMRLQEMMSHQHSHHEAVIR